MLQVTLISRCSKSSDVPRDGDFYLCGPSVILTEHARGASSLGRGDDNVHVEIFGTLDAITPGMARVEHTPHLPQGPPDLVRRCRSRVAGSPSPGIRNSASLLELAEACDVPVDGPAGRGVPHLHDRSDQRLDYVCPGATREARLGESAGVLLAAGLRCDC